MHEPSVYWSIKAEHERFPFIDLSNVRMSPVFIGLSLETEHKRFLFSIGLSRPYVYVSHVFIGLRLETEHERFPFIGLSRPYVYVSHVFIGLRLETEHERFPFIGLSRPYT